MPRPTRARPTRTGGGTGATTTRSTPPPRREPPNKGEHRRQPPSSSSDAARAFASSSHADDASANDPGELRVRYFPLHFVPVAASAFVFPRDAFASTAPVALANVSRRPIGGGGEEGGGKGGPTHQYTSYSPSPLLPPPDVDGSEEDGSVVPVPPGVPASTRSRARAARRDGRAGNYAPQFSARADGVAVAGHCASASPPRRARTWGGTRVWAVGSRGARARSCSSIARWTSSRPRRTPRRTPSSRRRWITPSRRSGESFGSLGTTSFRRGNLTTPSRRRLRSRPSRRPGRSRIPTTGPRGRGSTRRCRRAPRRRHLRPAPVRGRAEGGRLRRRRAPPPRK